MFPPLCEDVCRERVSVSNQDVEPQVELVAGQEKRLLDVALQDGVASTLQAGQGSAARHQRLSCALSLCRRRVLSY